MLDLIRKFDVLSISKNLELNEGFPRYKNLFGGTLSIFAFLLVLTTGLYFFLSSINREKNIFLSSTEVFTHKLNLDFSEVPIMIRVSDSNSLVLADKERVWGVKMRFWWGGSTDGSTVAQKSIDVPVEQCDINKHFGEFREYFVNYTDINTFYCPIFRPKNYTVNGIYGDNEPFSYYHFYIHFCRNSTTNNICKDQSYILTYLSNPFLDVRTIDYTVDIFSHNPANIYIRTDRHAISSTVYKRIWMYYKSILYTTDWGYFLPSTETDEIYQFNSFRYDADLRNLTTGSSIPGTFTTLTMLNVNTRMDYFRSFIKGQAVIANLGGIMQVIMTVFYLGNYMISYRMTNQYLINQTGIDLFVENSSISKNYNESFSYNSSLRSRRATILKVGDNANNISKVVPGTNQASSRSVVCVNSSNHNSNLNLKYTNDNNDEIGINFSNFNRVKFAWYEYVLPIRWLKKKEKTNIYEFYRNCVMKKLYAVNLIKLSNEFEKFKYLFLTPSQYNLLDDLPLKYIPDNENKSNKNIESYKNLIEKINKSELDLKYISLLSKKYS